MPSKIRFDIYTILIIAIVPTFLSIAWGLTWNHDRVAAKQACQNTEEYLTEVTEISDLYVNAGTLQNADVWLTRLEAIVPPSPARDLHDSVISSIRYATNVSSELETTQPAAVYEALTPFQQAIDNGRADIIDTCPEFATMIPGAFPMFFREGSQ
jgi:hypothetical protein